LYKKRSLLLALVVGWHISVHATEAATDRQTIEQVFTQQAAQCAPQLSAADLAVPGLLHEFYQRMGFEPIWQTDERRAALTQQLQALADDGMDPAAYPLGPAMAANPLLGACAELQTSKAYLRALGHLLHGVVAENRRESFWRAPGAINPLQPSVLGIAWDGVEEPARAFDQARPAGPRYQTLRRVYAERRRETPLQWQRLPAGPPLRAGGSDPRVPDLARRLAVQRYVDPHIERSERYDEDLQKAVERFQADHGLEPDGVLGPATLAALNTTADERLRQLKVNLERWRWLSREIEPDSLLVDIAGSLVFYYQGGTPVWRGRVQVGKADRQTPALKSRLSYLTLNPTWTVPPTILREDKLPEIRRDPQYLAQHNFQVVDLQGRPVDPASVDWNRPSGVMLRQAAGPQNPLGRMVIRFGNPFDVYLHDTPSQSLFARQQRALSSGCVRVEGIQHLLDYLLADDERAKVEQRLASGATSNYSLKRKLPILLAYWTVAFTDDDKVILRNDFYGLDAALDQALSNPAP
jgi:murein L,D-transpeptidase YcbB/YkuD